MERDEPRGEGERLGLTIDRRRPRHHHTVPVSVAERYPAGAFVIRAILRHGWAY